VHVPCDAAEPARAVFIELVPVGFEETLGDDRLELVAYVAADDAHRLTHAFPDAVLSPVAEGWEDAWRAFHRPVTAGGIWIGPPWTSPPAGTPTVVIDPGRAFGTGAHPTTRLCIDLLSSCPRGSLLDVGCGSGVLAIAAARLGFGPLVAVDRDPVAIEATIANACANRVAVAARVLDAERDPLPQADGAVVNVLLGPVERVLGELRTGWVVTSGYVVGERPAHAGWSHVESLELEGWVADRFRRVE